MRLEISREADEGRLIRCKKKDPGIAPEQQQPFGCIPGKSFLTQPQPLVSKDGFGSDRDRQMSRNCSERKTILLTGAEYQMESLSGHKPRMAALGATNMSQPRDDVDSRFV